MTTQGSTLRDYRPDQLQEVVDVVMKQMAIRHGSSRQRDFEVATLMLDALLASPAPSSPTGGEKEDKVLRRAHRSTDTTGAQRERDGQPAHSPYMRCAHGHLISPSGNCGYDFDVPSVIPVDTAKEIERAKKDFRRHICREFGVEDHDDDWLMSEMDALIASVAAASQQPIWDCRVCGYGVREGAALDWHREHGEHYNAVSERVPNKGTAYCPICSDETLRHP